MGSATLLFRVTAEGRVTGVIVAASTGDNDLDAASVTCAKSWRFHPMTFDRPTEIALSVSIQWILERGPHRISLVLRQPYNACVAGNELADVKLGFFHRAITIVSYTLKDGEVVAPTLKRSSGNDALDQRVLACVATWHFEPQTGAPYVTMNGSLIPSPPREPSPYDNPSSPESLTVLAATGPATAVFDWRELGAH